MHGVDPEAITNKSSLRVLLQELKTKVLEQVQDQLGDILDKALTETIPPFGKIHQTVNGTTTKKPSSRYRGDNFHSHTHITPFCSPQTILSLAAVKHLALSF